MLSSRQREELWNLIEPMKVGMLTSADEDTLRARPMHLVQDEFDGTLYFFTHYSAEKVEEIRDDNHVNISFMDNKADTYVSLSGFARLTQDKDLIDKYWNNFIAAWFPKGKHGGDVALLSIHISEAESWDTDSSSMVQLFKIAKANLTDSKPDMGENKKYG